MSMICVGGVNHVVFFCRYTDGKRGKAERRPTIQEIMKQEVKREMVRR